jgi:hypothetical protein
MSRFRAHSPGLGLMTTVACLVGRRLFCLCCLKKASGVFKRLKKAQ